MIPDAARALSAVVSFALPLIALVNHVGVLPWWIPLFFMFWLIGINYTVSWIRAPKWVRRRIRDAIQVAVPQGR